MGKLYCCRCKKESCEDVVSSVLLLESSGETESFDKAMKEGFSLCSSCKEEFLNVFMHKTIEEPHRIMNEDDLLSKASREDVREFMQDCGVNEDMALFISERVRKGLVASRGWREDMLEAMQAASVPTWFFEACKKINYLSRRDSYRPPYLHDTQKDVVNLLGITILSIDEFEKNKDLIKVRKPLWCRLEESSNQQDHCGVIIGPDIDGYRVYDREWGSLFPVIILEPSNQLEPGSTLLYAGDEYTVLRDGLAISNSEYLRMKLPIFCKHTFEETYLSKMLSEWFRDHGTVADVVDM